MDLTTLIGITLGVGCILIGQALEGGQLGSMVQLTAFVIVIGGTFGALVTQFPGPELRRALREIRQVFVSRRLRLEPLIAQLVELARRSRRDGLLALEDDVVRTNDPFLRQAIMSLVDGYDGPTLRSILEGMIDYEEECRAPGPRFFEAAGGYAPTIGIIGAVMGLIQVMEHLDDPSQLGSGIAVAFVATIYGVASANLVFLLCREAQDEDPRRPTLQGDDRGGRLFDSGGPAPADAHQAPRSLHAVRGKGPYQRGEPHARCHAVEGEQ